jgi:hypothetical protein
LPLPPKTARNSLPLTAFAQVFAKPRGDEAYWERVMAGQNFRVEDDLDERRFHQALWHGLRGEDTPYPTIRDGCDLSRERKRLLQDYQRKVLDRFGVRAEKGSFQ